MLSLAALPDARLADWREEARVRAVRLRHAPTTGEQSGFELVARALAASSLERRLPGGRPGAGQRLDVVLEDGSERGWLWTAMLDGTCLVLDARLEAPTPARTADLVTLLRASARGAGARAVEVSAPPGDPTLSALAEMGTRTASRMVLPLEPPPAPALALDLREAGPVEAAAHLASVRAGFLQERLHASPGATRDEVAREVEEIYAGLLPQGARTPGHHVLVAGVSTVWVFLEPPTAFVYDVVVDPAHRGQGLGRATMLAAAAWSAAGGARALGLNVFAHNRTARALYDSLGFTVVEDHVTLSAQDPAHRDLSR